MKELGLPDLNNTINLIYLKYFIDAAECESVSEAARKNFVTQSCVSQGIKKLELALKVDLTMHLRNRFKLTEEGKLVFQKGKQVFKSLDGILEEISQFSNVISGVVNIATTQSLALAFFPKIFQQSALKYPQVTLKIQLGSVDQIHQWIKSDVVDFALVLDHSDFARYERQEIAQGNFYLYKHKSLKKWDTVFVDFFSGIAVSCLDCQVTELRSWELVAEFLDSKLGAGVLPGFMTARYPSLVPIQNLNIDYKICGFYQKGTKLTKASHAVLSACGLQD
jgi:DNA-binding transcriptional LysR family regulator